MVKKTDHTLSLKLTMVKVKRLDRKTEDNLFTLNLIELIIHQL